MRAVDASFVLVLLLAPGLAMAEIYRCIDSTGTITFADLPCAANAEIHRPSGSLSVIASADSLDAEARTNREFIDQRRASLAAAQRAAAQQRRSAAAPTADLQAARSTPLSVRDRRRLLELRRAERLEAEQRRREQIAARSEPSNRRSTLLSRSGGNRERILN